MQYSGESLEPLKQRVAAPSPPGPLRSSGAARGARAFGVGARVVYLKKDERNARVEWEWISAVWEWFAEWKLEVCCSRKNTLPAPPHPTPFVLCPRVSPATARAPAAHASAATTAPCLKARSPTSRPSRASRSASTSSPTIAERFRGRHLRTALRSS